MTDIFKKLITVTMSAHPTPDQIDALAAVIYTLPTKDRVKIEEWVTDTLDKMNSFLTRVDREEDGFREDNTTLHVWDCLDEALRQEYIRLHAAEWMHPATGGYSPVAPYVPMDEVSDIPF